MDYTSLLSQIVNVANKSSYNDVVLELKIILVLNELGSSSVIELFNFVKDQWPNMDYSPEEFINKLVIWRFIDGHNQPVLNTIHRQSLHELVLFLNDYLALRPLSSEEKILALKNIIFSNANQYHTLIATINSIENDSENLLLEEYIGRFYILISDFLRNNVNISSYLSRIQDFYLQMKIIDIFGANPLSELLALNDFIYLNNLLDIPISISHALVNYNRAHVTASLLCLQHTTTEWIGNGVHNVLTGLTQKQEFVIMKRYSSLLEEEHTLEEVGLMLGVTRERVRQIESKALRHIRTKFRDLKMLIYLLYILSKKLPNYDLLFLAELKDYFPNVDSFNEFTRSIKLLESANQHFSDLLRCLWIGDKSEQEVVDKLLRDLPDIIAKSRLDNYPNIPIDFFGKYYNDRLGYFVRKGYAQSGILLEIVDKYFPQGYHISSDEDLLKLNNAIKTEYGPDMEDYERRQVEVAILNHEYQLIDKGTYKNSLNCLKIPQNLLEQMIAYVQSCNTQILYYNTLHHVFKDKLQQIGLANVYAVKGSFDAQTRGMFQTARTYIVIDHSISSAYDAIGKVAESFELSFSLSQLKMRFQGVQDYVLYNFFTSSGKYIILSDKRFIHRRFIQFSIELLNELITQIDSLMTLLQQDFITAHKLFARLSINRNDLLSRMELVHNPFDLFSILSVELSEYYNFKRPIIAKKDFVPLDSSELVIKYASTLERFSKKEIDTFIERNQLRSLWDYGEFMQIMADEFVQTDVGSMIRKDNFAIDSDKLQSMRKFLDYYLSIYNILDTESFQRYDLLPKINGQISKYLLVGIVRTYFSNDYFVENTDNMHQRTDFSIRRITHE